MEPRLKWNFTCVVVHQQCYNNMYLIFQVASIKVGIPLPDFRNVYHRPLFLPKDFKILSHSSCGIHGILVCFGVISSFCLFVLNDL